MPDAALPDSKDFIVPTRRSAHSEQKSYYMAAPTPSIAELGVGLPGKAPDAAASVSIPTSVRRAEPRSVQNRNAPKGAVRKLSGLGC
jgi:hypothetical protein